MKELVNFFGDSDFKVEYYEYFTGVAADWNVARSLYSIADIQSCIDKVRPVRFGEHLVGFADTYISNDFALYFHNF